MQEHTVVIKNRMGGARWGFRPEWAKTDDATQASKMINARSETVAEKASFRESWAKGRRCLVPADGFYEWKKNESGVNQPHYIYKPDEPLYFAGLWSKVDGLVTFTILTKPTDGDFQKFHSRCPVMVSQGNTDEWFSGGIDMAQDLVQESTAHGLVFHPVSRAVGKVANDEPGLIAETEEVLVPETSKAALLQEQLL